MMHHKLCENTMQLENDKCQIYVGCDDMEVFNELHEAIDEVLKKYYSFLDDEEGLH